MSDLDIVVNRICKYALIVWLACLAAITIPEVAGAKQPQRQFARAQEVVKREVYHPAERPGYACWTVLWPDVEGGIRLAFSEKRRAPNTTWKPVPLNFWESMSLPIKYHTSFCNGSKDVATELVVLKSDDSGKTWAESGRSPTKVINAFAWASLPGGRIIRARSDDYVAFDPGHKPQLRAEVSADGGTTWTTQAVILEGYASYSYRLKRLGDGTLVLLAPYQAGFGPGRVRATRHTIRPFVRNELELTAGVFVSTDEGKNWSSPLTAFPGIKAPEPDFVELPSGDLLFINSSVQHGRQARQYFRKTARGFVPGAVFEVVAGRAPECLVQTRDGLLVGAIRNSDYVCSNDEGATWHKIHSLPRCDYQPYMIELPDGRLLCTWHIGGDNFFGERDQWVGSTTFRLDADLPAPTRMTLARELLPSGDKYGNTYLATLTSGGKPLAGKTVHFAFHKRYTADYNASRDPKKAGTRRTAVTDGKGQARLDLSEFEGTTNIHLYYRASAWFTPDESDVSLAPCRSAVYGAYIINMSKKELGWPRIPEAKDLFDPSDTKTLGLETIEGRHAIIYRATDAGRKFSHHPNLAVFRDRLYCMWSSGLVDEDGSDQRVVYSESPDGLAWTEPGMLSEDEKGKGTHVASGFLVSGKTLVAYYTATGGSNFHARTVLMARTSQDGKTWSKPRRLAGGFFIEAPRRLKDSRLLIAGEHVGEARKTKRTRALITDDPNGLEGWKDVRIDFSKPKTFGYTEPSFFVQKDGALVMLLRNYSGCLYAARNNDLGRTWSAPARTNFLDSTARISAGNLPDGTAYIINNAMPKRYDRSLLTIALARDGVIFDRAWLVRGEPTKRRYDGRSKLDGWQYPNAIVWKDQLFIAYSINKEDIGITRIALKDLVPATGK